MTIPTTIEEQRHAMRSPIAVVKEAIAIEDVAAEYTELRSSTQDRYVGRCPLPDHEDKTPSFTVYTEPDDQRWWCFGCSTGGDVIDLEELAGRHAETWTAVVALSTRYGVELPRRPDRWHEAQNRKVDYLDAAYEVIGEVMSRRLYKTLILPFIDMLEDPVEREEELQKSWASWQRKRYWPRMARRVLDGNEDAILALAKAYLEAHPEKAFRSEELLS